MANTDFDIRKPVYQSEILSTPSFIGKYGESKSGGSKSDKIISLGGKAVTSAARDYLAGITDIDGNPLSPEAIDAIITTAQPEVPVVTTTSTGRGDNTSRTFTTTSRT